MSKENLKFIKGNYFIIWKRLFNIPGINLYESKINEALCTLFHTVTFFICAEIFGQMLNEKRELLDIIYSLSLIIAYVVCLSMILKRKKLMKVFDTLENGIFLPNIRRGRMEEIKLMQEHLSFMNKVGLTSLCTVMTIILTGMTFWIVYKYTKLPFGFFIKIVNTEITSILQSIWFFVIGVGYLLSDAAVFMVLSHVKLHLKNLEFCIKKLGVQDNGKIEENTVQWKTQLKEVVTYHTAILDVAKLIDEAFHLCHLVKFISLSVFFCLLMYGMSKIPISDGLFWMQSFYVIFVMGEINIIYYYGNEIIIQSQGIANCCYDVHFVGADIRLQKALLLIIQRSQRPIQMTVGKFAPLSLATSLAMMRATYSYFMVLRGQN